MSALRDIFRYVNPGTVFQKDDPYGRPNNSDMSDADFRRSVFGDDSAFELVPSQYSSPTAGDGGWRVREGSFLDRLGKDYGGSFQFGPNHLNTADKHSLQIDAGKLPSTKFGPIDRVAAIDDKTPLRNPTATDNDPNYGRITPLMNLRGNPELEAFTKLVMAAGTAGIGAMAGGLGPGLVNAARSAGSGNYGGALGGLAGMIPGIGPMLGGLLRAGLGQFGQQRRRAPSRQQQMLAAYLRQRRGG